MMPIGPLMIEHRLIERMIDVMREELKIFEKEEKLDPEFLETHRCRKSADLPDPLEPSCFREELMLHATCVQSARLEDFFL